MISATANLAKADSLKATLRKIRRTLMPNWPDEWASVQKSLPTLTGLHIGCGTDRFGDLERLDISPAVEPDIVCDLAQHPLPIESAKYDVIVAFNIIEHIPSFFDLMRELHRILKPGGKIVALVPHFSSTSAHIDPTHVKFLSALSFDYFCSGTRFEQLYPFYVDYRFKMVKRVVTVAGIWQFIPGLTRAISRKPDLWENHFCYIVRGKGVYVELVKQSA